MAVILLVFGILFIIAIIFSRLSERLGIPVLLIFLGIGILFGSDVLNIIYFDNALLAKQIADVLLIFILFEGPKEYGQSLCKTERPIFNYVHPDGNYLFREFLHPHGTEQHYFSSTSSITVLGEPGGPSIPSYRINCPLDFLNQKWAFQKRAIQLLRVTVTFIVSTV